MSEPSSSYDDLINALAAGVFVCFLGEPGTCLDKAWGALPQRARDERIEIVTEFLNDAIERSRGTLMDEWRK